MGTIDTGGVLGYEEIKKRLVVLPYIGMTMAEMLELPPELRPEMVQDMREAGKIIVAPAFTAAELEQQKSNSRIAQVTIDVELGDAYRRFCPVRDVGMISVPNNFVIRLNDPKTLELYDKLCPIRELHQGMSLVMEPGAFVRARSERSYLLPGDIMGELEGRSLTGRVGLVVHMTAPKIDPGFAGQIVFELCNLGPFTIELNPGDRIAQLIFHKVIGGIGSGYDQLRPGSHRRQAEMHRLMADAHEDDSSEGGFGHSTDELFEDTYEYSLPWNDAEQL